MNTMKLSIKIAVLGMSLCLFLSCCKKLFSDENLTLQRQDYIGTELRTDGYYYVFGESNNTAVYFLYRNGIILTVGGFSSQNLDDIEKELKNRDISPKSSWGVFVVNERDIQFEKWVGSTGIRACLYKYTGYIENDTIIHFSEVYSSEFEEMHSIDQTWHFKQFDHKPDSTNNYIK